MGTLNVTRLSGRKAKANYFHHLIRDLEALDNMVESGLIEKSPIRIGAEQEFFIVKNDFLPNNNSLKLLEAINDPHFTTEIGNFNLEINLDPIHLGGDCFSRLHQKLSNLLDLAKNEAAKEESKIILTGILPTLAHTNIGLQNMTPFQRYYVLNEAARESRAQDFMIHIKGVDELNLLHDSVMLESCNTSWQMHLQVDPDEFIDMFNWSQAIAGPVLAACCNSPLLFGRELWSETRIALFSQSVDIRTNSFLLNDSQSRVSFEDKWQRGTVSDIFKDNISRFRSLLTSEFDLDSVEMLKLGQIPKLKALNLHNGTVYRWNRACYGVGDGQPHLRIENRYIPSGPTVIDQVANFAFWVGLMKGRTSEFEDIQDRWDFKDIKANFYKAARYGMATQFVWDNRLVSCQELLLDTFIPMAKRGLKLAGIVEKDIAKYLKVIENRIQGRNGAVWTVESYRNLLKAKKKNEARQVLTAHMYINQEKNIPVSEWEILEPDTTSNFNIQKLVSHVMSTDIFSVEGKDPIELVVNMMRWNKIHHMPVVKGDKELIGLLSWSDVQKYLDSPKEIQLCVKGVMKKEVKVIGPESTLQEARDLMTKYQINGLPVVIENKLIGMVTSNDI
ncbi:CBS domain-containing protein [Cecembia rubra]|uniref:CBS domain-containing protein n=1 Tax=Cecembia rubra TaxID=1485585 RepID=UPI0027154C0E|nr:CBS domain-containing protein [Cecembia rubra]